MEFCGLSMSSCRVKKSLKLTDYQNPALQENFQLSEPSIIFQLSLNLYFIKKNILFIKTISLQNSFHKSYEIKIKDI